jgi:hypothetical protein
MSNISKNPNSAPQKVDSITKKNDELQQNELNKVTGGMRKAGGDQSTSGKEFLQFKFSTVFTT